MIYRLVYFLAIAGFFCSCSNKEVPEHAEIIPLHNAGVISINVQSISKKVVMDKLWDWKIDDLFPSDQLPDSSKKEFLSELITKPGDFGIDPLQNLYVVNLPGEYNEIGIVGKLDDKDKLIAKLQKFNYKQIRKFKNLEYVELSKQIILAFNKKSIVLLHSSGNGSERPAVNGLESFTKENKDSLLVNHARFSEIHKKGADVFFYFTKNQNSDAVTTLNFENGKISVAGDLQGELNYFNKSNSGSCNLNTNAPIAFTKFSLDLNRILADTTLLPELPDSVAREASDFFTGDIQYVLGGINKTQKEIVTYEFDEDFNKIEKKDTVSNVVFDFAASLQVKKDPIPFLEKWNRKGLLQKVDDFYVPVFTESPWKVKAGNSCILIYSQDSLVAAGKSITVPDGNNIVYVNILNMKNISTEDQLNGKSESMLNILESGFIKLNDDQKSFTGEITFKDKSKNSFVQLLDVARRYNDLVKTPAHQNL